MSVLSKAVKYVSLFTHFSISRKTYVIIWVETLIPGAAACSSISIIVISKPMFNMRGADESEVLITRLNTRVNTWNTTLSKFCVISRRCTRGILLLFEHRIYLRHHLHTVSSAWQCPSAWYMKSAPFWQTQSWYTFLYGSPDTAGSVVFKFWKTMRSESSTICGRSSKEEDVSRSFKRNSDEVIFTK